MFWSCYPLDLTVDWDRNDRLFCSRQGHKPRLTTSRIICVSFLLFFLLFDRSLNIQGWSFLSFSPFSFGTMTSMHKNHTERNTNIGSRLGLNHSTDFALNYGDKLLSRHYSYLRWACAFGTVHPRGKWISDEKTIILQCLHSTRPLFPLLPRLCTGQFAHYFSLLHFFFMLLRIHIVYSNGPIDCFCQLDLILNSSSS